VYETTTKPNGTFFGPAIPAGPATFTILPPSGLEPETLSILIGPNQRYVANVEPQHKNSNAVVSSLQIELLGPAIALGETRVVRVTVRGEHAQSLKPTIWVDGGIGTLDTGNRFTALFRGSGAIRAELKGVTAELPISIP
jgi:hypothetical protein